MNIYHWECFSDSFSDKIVVAHDLKTAVIKVRNQVYTHIKAGDEAMVYELEEALTAPPEIYELDEVVNV